MNTTTQTTSGNIAWFGESYFNLMRHLFTETIRRDTGKGIESYSHVDTALIAIEEKEHPLIVIEDTIALGFNTQRPVGIAVDDHPGMSGYLIRRTRESDLNRDTPIIVYGNPIPGYVEPELYLEAGATQFFDAGIRLSEFSIDIKSLLRE
jgi:hypothetical protein